MLNPFVGAHLHTSLAQPGRRDRDDHPVGGGPPARPRPGAGAGSGRAAGAAVGGRAGGVEADAHPGPGAPRMTRAVVLSGPGPVENLAQ